MGPFCFFSRKEFHLDNITGEPNSFLTPIERSDDLQTAAQTWAKLRHSCTLLKFSEAEIRAFCSVLAAIYHLGVAGSVKGQCLTNQSVNQNLYSSPSRSLLSGM